MATIEKIKITDFKQDPSNANKGTERGLRMLDDSIAEDGVGRSGLADKNGILIAGNKTQERLVDRGIEDAIVVHTSGDEWVIVQRDDLDLLADNPDNPARRLAYRDNRTAEVDLEWDSEQLLADMNAGLDLSKMFFEWEVDTLIGKAAESSDPNELWQGMPEFENEAKALKSIHIHFKTQADIDAFSELLQQEITEKTSYLWYPERKRDVLKDLVYSDES